MKIVVRGANWIGDAVMTIPALRSIRQLYPEASITLHTRPWAEGVFRDADFIDDILTIPASGFKPAAVSAQVRQLKKHRFDLAVLFPNSFESALVARVAGIPDRLGYSTEKRGFLLTQPRELPRWKGDRHETNYYLDLVVEGSLEPTSGDVRLRVSESRKESAKAKVRKTEGQTGRPLVGLGAGSTNSLAKRWPAAYFAMLADRLASEVGADLCIMGAANERDVAEVVKSSSRSDFIDLTGATDLADATAILSVLDLFVSNDMGLSHISAAVGTPTIVIFGPTNDVTTRPLGESVEIIREPVECSPCMLRVCPIDHRCMTRISPDRVFESARKMLETRTR